MKRLINNAGIIIRTPAVEHPDEYWDKVYDLKQFITWFLAIL
jgi:2-deoxy-D-gluconate 3-dehydrogenase